ncbi:MAG: RCC1 domain-containing protein, partial [Gemmatimonadales bacterium]
MSSSDLEAPALAASATQTTSFLNISSNSFRSCGVTQDNRIYCWGNGSGFVPGSLHFRLVSVGFNHTCGVTTDKVAYCWGENFTGQLGDGTATPRSVPTPVLGSRTWNSVRAGGFHTCGVTTDNRAFCWGRDSEGQVGDGVPENSWRMRPVLVAGGLSWRQVIPGWAHTCGVTTSNRAYCWGVNLYGRLGDGTTSDRLTPVAVVGGLLFRQISPGVNHTCGVTTDWRAYCWGWNFLGQLGDGTRSDRQRPVPVAGGKLFRTVEAGFFHSCGMSYPDNRGYCWGGNDRGQLGDGTNTTHQTPVAVAGAREFRQVTVGHYHSCGVTTANRAYCWGDSEFGQV